VWQALESLEQRRNRDVDPLMERWSLAYPILVGHVHAGDWASAVPDLLVAEGRFGVALGESIDAAKAVLEAAMAEVSASDPWLRDHPVEVEWWGGKFASGRLPESSDLVERLTRAQATTGAGRVPDVYGAPYGSDLRLMTGVGGVPTIQYGPGDAVHAHSPLEHVAVADIATAARTLAALAVDVCGVAE
jgi:acetylornithine deacetylase